VERASGVLLPRFRRSHQGLITGTYTATVQLTVDSPLGAHIPVEEEGARLLSFSTFVVEEVQSVYLPLVLRHRSN